MLLDIQILEYVMSANPSAQEYMCRFGLIENLKIIRTYLLFIYKNRIFFLKELLIYK
jgi:hypothetical protein